MFTKPGLLGAVYSGVNCGTKPETMNFFPTSYFDSSHSPIIFTETKPCPHCDFATSAKHLVVCYNSISRGMRR